MLPYTGQKGGERETTQFVISYQHVTGLLWSSLVVVVRISSSSSSTLIAMCHLGTSCVFLLVGNQLSSMRHDLYVTVCGIDERFETLEPVLRGVQYLEQCFVSSLQPLWGFSSLW
jgi:hypothetical protein